MAIRNDITVTTSSSPRTINIAAPSTTVSVRDLIDTLKSVAPSQESLIYDEIHTAGGYFGPTLMLYDAQVAFQGHTAFAACTIDGGVILGNQPQLIADTPNTQVTIIQAINALSGGDELTVERYLQLSSLLGDIPRDDELPDNLYIANNGDPYIDASGNFYVANN